VKIKNKWMLGILWVWVGLNAGCTAARTGSMAGANSHDSVAAANEQPLGKSYGAVSSSSSKPSSMNLGGLSVGQSTGNGTPPSNSDPTTGDPMNQ